MQLVQNSVTADWQNRAATQDAAFANELIDDLPGSFQRKLLADYVSRYNDPKKGARNANVFLRMTVQRLRTHKIPLYAIASDDSAEAFAKARAAAALKLVANESEVFKRYMALRDYCEQYGIEAPFTDRKKVTYAQLMTGQLKMVCQHWWLRKVKRHAAKLREFLAISLGFVGKGGGKTAYASKDCRAEYKAQQKRNQEFMQSQYLAMEIEDERGYSDYEYISIAAASQAGVSNPEIRRKELMARLRGMQTVAEEQGLTAMFYTITAPSKYHRASKKWDGSSPTDTGRYLVDQWAKVRAELNDASIKIAGIRVAEPHADATPHWHMLFFIRPAEVAAVTSTLRRYAMQHDADEKGAEAARFQAVEIDHTKGDAVGYIAKYISKNINAKHVENEDDEETGGTLLEGVDGVAAWASRWRIRQFQFIGGAPVGIWREMRREREAVPHAELESVREHAEKGRFAQWLQLMGGLFVKRDQLPVWLAKEEKTSAYGEMLKKTVGFVGFGVVAATRKVWLKVGQIGAFAFGSASDLQGASRAARSAGNNCKWALNPEQYWANYEKAQQELAELSQKKPGFAAYLDSLGAVITERIDGYFENFSLCEAA